MQPLVTLALLGDQKATSSSLKLIWSIQLCPNTGRNPMQTQSVNTAEFGIEIATGDIKLIVDLTA